MIKIKNTKNIVASICLILCAGACTDATDAPRTEGDVLRLSSISLLQEPENTPRNRGVVTTTDINTIRLYATDQTTAHQTYVGVSGSSAKGYADFTRSGENWTAGSEKIVINTHAAPIIHAFYPADLEVTNTGVNSHTVPVTVLTEDNFTGDHGKDYLYMTPVTMNPGDKTIAVTLQHALAKVSLRIEKAATVSEVMTVTRVEILSKNNSLKTGTNLPMSLDNGVINQLTSTSVISLTGSYALNITENKPNMTCLTAPTTLPVNDLSFRIHLDGYSEPLTTALVTGKQQWLAGHHYVYHITVSKLGAGFTGMKVYDWQSDANQNTSIGI